eukprot:6178693-Pleurochrysis_carterae.AAC.4
MAFFRHLGLGLVAAYFETSIRTSTNRQARAAYCHRHFCALEGVWHDFKLHDTTILGLTGRDTSAHSAVHKPASLFASARWSLVGLNYS